MISIAEEGKGKVYLENITIMKDAERRRCLGARPGTGNVTNGLSKIIVAVAWKIDRHRWGACSHHAGSLPVSM